MQQRDSSVVPSTIFYSFSEKDEKYQKRLESHLSPLRMQGIVTDWHFRKIIPGMIEQLEIDTHLAQAQIILLLVSADFLASQYHYSHEMRHALERQSRKEALIIPILLRPCDWEGSPLSKLHILPTTRKPITRWKNLDEGFLDVVQGIKAAVKNLQAVAYPAASFNDVSYNTSSVTFLEHTYFISNTPNSDPRPKSYLPPRNSLFQPRPGEFERLERILVPSAPGHESFPRPLVGITGMGGAGKTALAIEFAYRYQDRFPAGVFWMPAVGTHFSVWQSQIAQLAVNTGYLPHTDTISLPENEVHRASHFCRYLADHKDALLILDHVDDPSFIASILTTLDTFAGKEVKCAIIYTSHRRSLSPGAITFPIEALSEHGAIKILLSDIRPELLKRTLEGDQGAEALAVREICQGVGYLPLALVHLQGMLSQNRQLSLTELARNLRARGALRIAAMHGKQENPLFAMLQLSWEQVHDERAQNLFKLASYFPAAVPIPLWLLGIASGLSEDGTLSPLLSKTLALLDELNFLERSSNSLIRLHPLVREFGRFLCIDDPSHKRLVLAAKRNIKREFENLYKLHVRVHNEGYWACLEQLQSARNYLELLGPAKAEHLRRLERWFARESYLFEERKKLLERFPGLFYQQFFNRSIEEGHQLSSGEAPERWLKQERSVGAEDQSLVTIFAGHRGKVRSAVFMPDPTGIKVLTGAEDGIIRLWEPSSGKLVVALRHHFDSVTSINCTLSGKRIASGSQDGTALILEVAEDQLLPPRILMTLTDHNEGVTSVAFSGDEKLIITGSADGVARIWDAANGNCLQVLKGHTGGVWSVALSSDGKRALTGSTDRTARLWDTSSGQLLKALQDHKGTVGTVIFSPDGHRLLTGSNDGTARLWDASSGECLRVLDAHTDKVTCAAFSHDGEKIVTGSMDHTIRLWNANNGKLISLLTGHTQGIRSVEFSPDGTQIITGSDDHTARLWNVTHKKNLVVAESHRGRICCVAFSSDGEHAFTGSDDNTIRMWDVARRTSLTVSQMQIADTETVVLSPDGAKVLSCSDNKSIYLWDIVSGNLLATLSGHTGFTKIAAFSPNGTKVCISTDNNALWIWEIVNEDAPRRFQGNAGNVKSLIFSPDGTQILTGSDDGIARLWDVESGRPLISLSDHLGAVRCLAFSPDGSHILTGADDGVTRLWRTKGGYLLATFEDRRGRITSGTFSPDGRLMLTCDEHGWVFLHRLKDTRVGELLGVYVATYNIGAIYWRDTTHLILADTGGPQFRPHFYHLKIEGIE